MNVSQDKKHMSTRAKNTYEKHRSIRQKSLDDIDKSENCDNFNLIDESINLSLSGCGFLGTYHLGVIAYLREHGRHILSRIERIYGASGGALVGICLLAGFSTIQIAELILSMTYIFDSNHLGIFDPNIDILQISRSYLNDHLPDNIHLLCTNKLFISLTSFPSFRPVIVSVYNTRKDLIDALICSSFIPIIFGFIPPTFNGKWYIDGGFTDNLPQDRIKYKRTHTIKEEMLLRKSNKYSDNLHGIRKTGEGIKTITVAPFIGEGDICPKEKTIQSLNRIEVGNMTFGIHFSNLKRLFRGFIKPSTDSIIEHYIDGYNDAHQYISTATFKSDTDIILKKFETCTIKISLPSSSCSNIGKQTSVDEKVRNVPNNSYSRTFIDELDTLLSIEPNELIKKYEKYRPYRIKTNFKYIILNLSMNLAKWNLNILKYLTKKSLRIAAPIIERFMNILIPIIRYFPMSSRIVDFLGSLRLALNELNNN